MFYIIYMGKDCLIINYKFNNTEIKNKFREELKKRNLTMQAAFSIFINHLTGGTNLLDEIKMKPKKITYGYTPYEFFTIEKVYIDDEPNGEYHIKINDGSSSRNALIFFQMYLENFQVGMVDEILNIEYPIYAKTSDTDTIKNVDSVFTELNKQLEGFRKR